MTNSDNFVEDIPPNSDRQLVVDFVKSTLKPLSGARLDELVQAGDRKTHPELLYPSTKGEIMIDHLVQVLASQDWIDGESEPILDDMLGVASMLDIDIENEENWRILIELSGQI